MLDSFFKKGPSGVYVSNRDFYKDEYGNFHEVDDELEDPTDGFEDDEQDHTEEDYDSEDLFDSAEDDESDFYDEDEEYASERRGDEYDIDDD